jgi:hypothetical protein
MRQHEPIRRNQPARESDGSDKPLRLIAQDLSELTERRPELSGDRECSSRSMGRRPSDIFEVIPLLCPLDRPRLPRA